MTELELHMDNGKVDRFLAYLNVRISFLDRLFLESDKASQRRQAYTEKKEVEKARAKYLEVTYGITE